MYTVKAKYGEEQKRNLPTAKSSEREKQKFVLNFMFYQSLYSEGQVEVGSRGILKRIRARKKTDSPDIGGGGGLEKKILIEIVNFL